MNRRFQLNFISVKKTEILNKRSKSGSILRKSKYQNEFILKACLIIFCNITLFSRGLLPQELQWVPAFNPYLTFRSHGHWLLEAANRSLNANKTSIKTLINLNLSIFYHFICDLNFFITDFLFIIT